MASSHRYIDRPGSHIYNYIRMLDLEFVRKHPEKVRYAATTKGMDKNLVDETVDEIFRLDTKRKHLIQAVEKLRAERNTLTKDDRERGVEIKKKLKDVEPQLKTIEENLKDFLPRLPNLPAEDVKVGKDESQNEIIKKWGKPKKFSFTPKDHIELGERLGLLDVKRAAKVSGARFGYLLGDAVALEFALIQYAFAFLLKQKFIPILPPVLLKVPVFHSLGYSANLGSQEYYVVKGGASGEEEGEYYLVGTAEHSIIPYFKDEILGLSELPRRFVGFSTAFRREAGSYGKDTRGILRVHQFDKVEMVSFTTPETSDKEHEFLLGLEEKLFRSLKIPYQVIKMCTGDLGHPTARKYDLEAWIPSQGKYREVTSTSTTTDFQARSLNIKYRHKGGTAYAHTLNGTAFAIGRTLIAILENYQQKDGSVTIPAVLQKYMGKKKITG